MWQQLRRRSWLLCGAAAQCGKRGGIGQLVSMAAVVFSGGRRRPAQLQPGAWQRAYQSISSNGDNGVISMWRRGGISINGAWRRGVMAAWRLAGGGGGRRRRKWLAAYHAQWRRVWRWRQQSYLSAQRLSWRKWRSYRQRIGGSWPSAAASAAISWLSAYLGNGGVSISS